MIYVGYNGWSGKIRTIRGTLFYRKIKKSISTDTCSFCGDTQKHTSLSWHAEEYGSSWEQYIDHTYRLCPRCHGMVHIRFKAPNLWARYVHKVKLDNFGGCRRFLTLNSFFTYVRGKKDIEEYPWRNTGNIFIDNLPRIAYSGVAKIATAEVSGIVVPDPTIYAAGWKEMSGVIMVGNTFEQRTYFE